MKTRIRYFARDINCCWSPIPRLITSWAHSGPSSLIFSCIRVSALHRICFVPCFCHRCEPVFGRRIFSVARNIKYIIIGLPLISVTASVVFGAQEFSWGGAVGDLCKDWLYNSIGAIGTVGLIIVAFLSYVIWRFNPNFDFYRAAKRNL